MLRLTNFYFDVLQKTKENLPFRGVEGEQTTMGYLAKKKKKKKIETQ